MLLGVGIGSVADDSSPEEWQNLSVLIMQLADGTVQDKRFAGEALIMVAWALASTLALLNAAGFIHGDLKPGNVLWQADDGTQVESVVLLSF